MNQVNPEYSGIYIQWFGTPCHCRCRHCLLRSGEKLSKVPFAKVRALAERFVRWRTQAGLEFSVDLVAGYQCDSPEYLECAQFNKQHGQSAWWFMPLNGTRIKDDAELEGFLSALKTQGITSIGLTFYGLGEDHDRWAGRPGDFNYILRLARMSVDHGLDRQETVFLSQTGLGHMPELIGLLDSLSGNVGRSVCPWDFRGFGKRLESERILAKQVDGLPDEVKRHVNLDAYASEAEWIGRIATGSIPVKSRRLYMLSVWEENIRELEATECDRILENMRSKDDSLRQALPSLQELASLYGDKSEDRLYKLRDLQWKWTDAHIESHPGVDSSGLFDDLSSCIMQSGRLMSKEEVSLNARWRLACFEDGEGFELGAHKPKCNAGEWMDAVVPGDVHLDLLRAGKIAPDVPFENARADV